jgi:hypothetical protein
MSTEPVFHTFRDRFVAFCVFITGARIFGHGRRVELVFAISAFVYALELAIVRNGVSRVIVTEDIFWGGYGHYMLPAMWLLFLATGGGLWFNIKAWPYSQPLRIVGAFLGFLIYGWMGLKLAFVGNLPSPGHVFSCVFGLVAEPMVFFNACANLPRPGAPGNMGVFVGR